jgi:hypothetical protein
VILDDRREDFSAARQHSAYGIERRDAATDDTSSGPRVGVSPLRRSKPTWTGDAWELELLSCGYHDGFRWLALGCGDEEQPSR